MPSFSTRSWKPACVWRAASLAVLLLLGGCAQLTLLTSEDLTADIEKARREQDFRTARYLINSAADTHPQYESIRAQASKLDREISDFEKQVHRETLSLARAGNWRAAHERLDTATDRLPDSAALASTRSALEQREERVQAQAVSALLLAEGRWLADHGLQVRTLDQLTSSAARRAHKTLAERRSELVLELSELGQWFAQQEDWQRTHQLLSLSRELAADGSPASELERKASQALTSASYRKRQQQVRRQRDQAEALLGAYRDSGNLSDLLKARDYISAHSDTLERLDQEVTQLCQQIMRAGLGEGENLYAQGKYLQAQQAWQRILPISPEHPELNKKLERVGRVLQNLEALQRD